MKFARNARIFRGHLEAAPFAGVFFLLLILLLLQSSLVHTPGVRIQLPTAIGLPGPAGPTLKVAVGEQGQLFFRNRLVKEADLRDQLLAAVKAARAPLTLVIQADRKVSNETLVRLSVLAQEVGVREVWLGTQPRLFPAPGSSASRP